MQLPLFNTYLLICLLLYFPITLLSSTPFTYLYFFTTLPLLFHHITSTFSPHYLLLPNQDFMLSIILIILVILILILILTLTLILSLIILNLIILVTLIILILILILILHFFAFQKDSTSMLTTILLSELSELPTVTTNLYLCNHF